MLISSKGRYALRLMIYIAALGDAEGKIALREVADREHISQKYLEQLVRPLMKAGLLRSVRGKGGGYMMAKDPAEVRAGDILRAVEGSTAPVACDGIDSSCPDDLCSTVKFWRGLDDVIEYVDGVTLADLAAVPRSTTISCRAGFREVVRNLIRGWHC
ncbi:MAG: RrF2 family transcriptional regulator [Collinsella aerofaciens]